VPGPAADTDDVVRTHVEDGLAVVELNRPGASNALDTAMKVALLEALTAVGADDSVRAVLLRATGKHFCVGQDLAEHAAALADDSASALDTVRRHYNPIVLALARLDVPVVAALTGACVGAGLGIALTADIRVAGEGSRFGTAFTAIGLAADSGLSATLVRAVGAGRARDLFLTAETVTAPDALAWGLVTRVVPDAEVADTALALARRLAAGPTAAFAEARTLLDADPDRPLADVLEDEAAAQSRLATTADHRGAVEAFLAKARPTFTGA
jgi:2-(1,2-epoxy-1,2-dihydrophenyl)acetyl-CoA isomerase